MKTTQKVEYTLLHVEDSLDLQELVRQILPSRPSINVLNASTVKEGVNLARHNLPDLILMDINLPDSTGMDALKKIQTCKETTSIPVVALSSLV